MEILQKTIEKKGLDYYSTHLELINPVLPVKFTPMEIKVLAAFLKLEGPLAEVDRFNSRLRKDVRIELGLSDGGLGNYLRTLKEKVAIKEDIAGNLYIQDFLFPKKDQQFYQFKLINKG